MQADEQMTAPPPAPPIPAHLAVDTSLPRDTAISKAIGQSDVKLLKELLDEGHDPNENTFYGPPLSLAVRKKDIKLVEVLLSHKQCNVNVSDYDGQSILILSINYGSDDITKYLISHGACVDQLDAVNGLTPLSYAVLKRKLEIIRFILQHGCDVQMKDKKNLSALAHACLLREDSCNDLKRDIIELLLQHGASMNTSGGRVGSQLIHRLINDARYFALSFLIEYSKKLDTSSSVKPIDIESEILYDKSSPLFLTVQMNDKVSMEILLENGANVEHRNIQGDTALTIALRDLSQLDIIKLLLQYGADPNHEITAKSFKVRNKFTLPLFIAIENGNKELVDMLLSYGADISKTDYRGSCAVMPCVSNGTAVSLLRYIVSLLDKNGARYDISSWRYLNAAFASYSHLQFLIDRGLDVNAKNPANESILFSKGILSKSMEIALDNGLDPDSLSSEGHTLLCQVAGDSRFWPTIQLLVQHGTDINMRQQSATDESATELTPVQKAFIIEYSIDGDTDSNPSQLRYFLNCGATCHPEMSLWRDQFIADKPLTTKRQQLLRDFDMIFSPLRLEMICREVIRKYVIKGYGTSSVKSYLYSLPLPTHLKYFLAFVNVPTDYVVR